MSGLVESVLSSKRKAAAILVSVPANTIHLSEDQLTETVGISRGVVGATVAAGIAVGGLAGVLGDEQRYVVTEARVGVVGDDGGGAAGRVARHILVDVGEDRLALGLVVGKDVGRADKTDLLTTIPVELEGVLRGKSSLGENTEGLEDDDGARGVVIGARGLVRRLTTGRVKVSTDDDYEASQSAGQVATARIVYSPSSSLLPGIRAMTEGWSKSEWGNCPTVMLELAEAISWTFL